LEAVKEVVRQLRLRDIGGIIVIDFIDMANPKNRATVEEALRSELERDRTKTYVVEISPLGLVEMTRQNVTDGPREIMTRKCPTCGGDGIVYSEASAAIDVERRLRALAAGSRSQAFRVEVAAPIASALVGPAARRLVELESLTKRRFFLEGKKVKVRVERVLDGVAYATLVRRATGKAAGEPLTAEAEAEKPTRKPPARKTGETAADVETDAEAADEAGAAEAAEVEEAEEAAEVEEPQPEEGAEADEAAAPAKKKTRRGSRGGRNRRKPAAAAGTPEAEAAEEELAAGGASEDGPEPPRV